LSKQLLADAIASVSVETKRVVREFFGCWERVHLRGETTLGLARHKQQPTIDTPL